MLVIWWLVTCLVAANAVINDVTTIYRMQNAGSQRLNTGYIPVEGCYNSSSNKCSWQRSGWETTDHKQDEFTIKPGNLSPTISLSTDDISYVTIHPHNQLMHYYFMTDDSHPDVSPMLMVVIDSTEDLPRAYLCYGGTGTTIYFPSGPKSVNKRRCKEIERLDVVIDSGSNNPQHQDYTYLIKFTPSSQTLEIERQIGPKKFYKITFLKKFHQVIDIGYLIIATDERTQFPVEYSTPVLGLKLSQYYGLLISPESYVTESETLLCISVTANMDTSVSKLSVNITFNGQDSVTVGATDGGPIHQVQDGRQTWNFLTDLKGMEEKSFRIEIDIQGKSVFISGISGCTNLINETTVTNTLGSVEVHSRTNALGYPFVLHNGTVVGADADVIVPECNAVMCEWEMKDEHAWIRKRIETNETDLITDSGKAVEFLSEDEPTSQDFVDNVEIKISVTRPANDTRALSILFLKEKDTVDVDDDMYDLRLEADDMDESKIKINLYKCSSDVTEGDENDQYSFEEEQGMYVKSKDGTCIQLHETKQFFAVEWKQLEVYHLRVKVSRDSTKKQSTITLKWMEKDGSYRDFHWEDDNSFTVTSYRTRVVPLSAVVRSRGHGDLYFSLEKNNGDFTSPPILQTTQEICISLDYFSEKDESENKIEVFLMDKNNISRTILLEYKKSLKFEAGKWNRLEYIGMVPSQNREEKETRWSVVVNARKKSDSRLWIQRVADCSHNGGENSALLVDEERPLTVTSPGFNIAKRTQDNFVPPRTCQNGGNFYDGEGCDCPAGFNGTSCEEGCGPNRYGADCGGVCSITDENCRGLVLCRPKLGCNCAPGYTRYPLCDTTCVVGETYGPSCQLECGNCTEGTACDIYTGVCHHGCQSGYMPPRCRQKYSYLAVPPTTTKITETTTRVYANLGNFRGIFKPSKYQIQYKLDTETSWKEESIKDFKNSMDYEHNNTNYEDIYKLENLEPGATYQVRVVLIHSDRGSYQREDVPIHTFTTDCTVPESVDYNLEVESLGRETGIVVRWQFANSNSKWCSVVEYEFNVRISGIWRRYTVSIADLPENRYTIRDLLPGVHQYQVRMRGISRKGPLNFSKIVKHSVETIVPLSHVTDLKLSEINPITGKVDIMWNPPRFADKSLTYKIIFQCIEILACRNVSCTEDTGNRISDDPITNIYTKNLISNARYNVSIAALVLQPGGEHVIGPVSSVQLITEPTETKATPTMSSREPSKSEISLTFYWNPPSDAECEKLNGIMLGYRAVIKGHSSVTTSQTFATFANLNPNKEYEVKVYVLTAKGINEEKYLSISAKTAAPTPQQVNNLTAYKRNNRMIGVKWSDPSYLEGAGEITSFQLTYHPTKSPFSVTRVDVKLENKCSAWREMYCFVIDRVKKKVEYTITVTALSDGVVGKPSSTKVWTKEDDAPTAPTDLKAVATSSTSIKISWGIPNMLNGELKRFVIVIEHLAEDANLKMTQELNVNEETESYTHEVSSLHPSSEYEVTVQAMIKTLKIGEGASTKVKTKS